MEILKFPANMITLPQAKAYLADTNGDGNITIADSLEIQKYLANTNSTIE
ncbi:MAG: hypothetical protein FWG83_08000 [Oscillospiraceae bacterium]|nr:hypothetical protein [Oscillospiraceae bacterium]